MWPEDRAAKNKPDGNFAVDGKVYAGKPAETFLKVCAGKEVSRCSTKSFLTIW